LINRFRQLDAAWLLVLLLVVPLLVLIGQTRFDLGGRYHAPGDFAAIELLTRDVVRHPPLVGLYSRVDWHHPGPMFFYVLALPYRLLGSDSAALDSGAVIVNGAALVATVWIARRRGGLALMCCTLLGLSLLVHGLGPDFIRSPWNPSLPVLPFALMTFLVWSMLEQDAWALPAGVVVATFLVQTHVGYVLIALPMLLLGIVALLAYGRRGEQARLSVIGALLISIGVGVVLWIPPIIDQFTNTPGNLGRVVNYFQHPDDKTHSFLQAWRLVAGEFSRKAEWLHGAQQLSPFAAGQHPFTFGIPAPLLLIPFGLAGVVFWRRHMSSGLRLMLVIAVAFASGVLAAMRTVGPLLAYRVQWTWVIGALAMVATVWAVWSAITARWPWAQSRVLVPVTVVALVGIGVANTVDAADAGMPIGDLTPKMNSAVTEFIPKLPPGPGVIVVRNPTLDGYFYPGVVLALEQHHIPVRIESDPLHLLGSHRVYRGGPVRAAISVITNNAAFITPPGERMIAYGGSCPPEQLVREVFDRSRLDIEHKQGKLTDQQYFDAIARLCPQFGVGIFLDPK
jgi:hypothetical protein